MKIGYVLCATLLAGGLLATPAFAGVTGTTGGEKSDVTTNKFNTTVKGDLHYWEKSSGWYYDEDGERVWTDTDKHVYYNSGLLKYAVDSPQVQDAINSMIGQMYSYVEGGRPNASGIHHSVTYSGVTSTSIKSNTNDAVSKNAIMCGDPDALANAHVASGSVDRRTNINHYDVYQINVSTTVSPIVLDLDGDGRIEASNGKHLPHAESFDASHAVMFDFHGNGFPLASEWVGAQDGLLCRPNADGSVKGTNLFGTANGFDNGFDEMEALDANANGALEGAELDGLMVWTDTDANGVASASELHSLDSLGITSIGVTNDNLIGSFTRNGKSFKSFDWWPSVVEGRKVDVAQL